MATTPHLLTYQEWLQLPPVEDGREEVVKGELRVWPPNQYPHADVVELIIEAILPQIDRKKIRILGSTFGLMIHQDPLTCRSPDLAVFWREKREVRDGIEWVPPDLVIEIISPSENKRRKEEKLSDYASIGVPEVWLVSPEAQSVEVRLLHGGTFERESIQVDGELRPTRFPGISIPVTAIWPD